LRKLKKDNSKPQHQAGNINLHYLMSNFGKKGAWKLDKKLERETQHRWSEVVNTLARPIKNFCHQIVFFLKGYISKGLQVMNIFSEKELGKYFVFYN